MPLGERALSEGLSGIAWSSFQSAVERHRGDRDRRACRQILQSSAPIPSKLLEALQGVKLASTLVVGDRARWRTVMGTQRPRDLVVQRLDERRYAFTVDG